MDTFYHITATQARKTPHQGNRNESISLNLNVNLLREILKHFSIFISRPVLGCPVAAALGCR